MHNAEQPVECKEIVSYIGDPLYTNSQTATQVQISYARICIKMDVNSDFPKSIPLCNKREGEKVIQEVVYEWPPPKCNGYQNFFFFFFFFCNLENCLKKPKKQANWVPEVTKQVANLDGKTRIWEHETDVEPV
ncbi:hypothetical protein ACH5RR_008601 [Cinchona calisaya]|uniref:Uncharacterized protein n=1 Tax=Cinchona calisaya TaxID=153742 RepID=A0ABD3ADK6_9GENT